MDTLSAKNIRRKYYFKGFCSYYKSLLLPLSLFCVFIAGACFSSDTSNLAFYFIVTGVLLLVGSIFVGFHFHMEVKPMIEFIFQEAIEEWHQDNINMEYSSLQSKFNRTF
ncbi:hypothetical protein_gp205 [Bacillus phage vB_BceM_WH1]|nr:hypothetical protein_gp205 [Bacillus phage vB_BceM_WH1]